MLSGSMNPETRGKSVQNFEENTEVQFLLISLKADGTGLNLTDVDYIFITNPWWNPAIENQVIARTYRIGQTKNVIATKFITKNTIEEKILLLQQKKKQLADDIINNSKKLRFSKSDLEFLLVYLSVKQRLLKNQSEIHFMIEISKDDQELANLRFNICLFIILSSKNSTL